MIFESLLELFTAKPIGEMNLLEFSIAQAVIFSLISFVLFILFWIIAILLKLLGFDRFYNSLFKK